MTAAWVLEYLLGDFPVQMWEPSCAIGLSPGEGLSLLSLIEFIFRPTMGSETARNRSGVFYSHLYRLRNTRTGEYFQITDLLALFESSAT